MTERYPTRFRPIPETVKPEPAVIPANRELAEGIADWAMKQLVSGGAAARGERLLSNVFSTFDPKQKALLQGLTRWKETARAILAEHERQKTVLADYDRRLASATPQTRGKIQIERANETFPWKRVSDATVKRLHELLQ